MIRRKTGYIEIDHKLKLTLISLLLIFQLLPGCEKKNTEETTSGFILSSPEIKADSLLPSDYTCDGVSATLPLTWSGAPEGVVSFAVIMHHVASPTDVHLY